MLIWACVGGYLRRIKALLLTICCHISEDPLLIKIKLYGRDICG